MISITLIISAIVVLSYLFIFPKTMGVLRPIKVPALQERK